MNLTLSSTSRQILLGYTAPDTNACTIEVSEAGSYAPVVNDVNASLFSGSSLDNRSGALGAGSTTRAVVIGTIPLPGQLYDGLGSDGKHYSRTLQIATTHYIRVTCGADVGTGSISTKNIPAGKTYPEVRAIGTNGLAAFPTLGSNRLTDRGQTFIDSATGVKYRRLTMPRDVPSDSVLNAAFISASGTNWSNPSNILIDDGSVTSYTAGSQDWLYVAAPNLNIQISAIYAIKLLTKGNATGSGDNAVLQMCLTRDGVTCLSDIQEITLSSTPGTTICFPASDCSDPPSMNTWRNPQLTKEELSAGSLGSVIIGGWGVLMRKKGTGAGTVNLQYAQFDWLVDYQPGAYDNGAQWACGPATINDSSGNAGYLCAVRMQGFASTLYWVPTNTALTSRFLGFMRMVGEATMPNFYVSVTSATFSDTDPRKYYFVALDNASNQVLVEALLPASGSTYYDTDAASGALWTATYTNLTIAPNDLTSRIHDVDSTFTASFGCSESTVQRGRVTMKCRRGFQDSYGYMAMFKLSTGLIERVSRTWDNTLTRWCGYHTEEPASKNSQQYMYTVSELNKGGVASGPFTFTLNGAVNDSQTNFTVTSTHSTPGEPVEANAPTELMDRAVGDLFAIDSEVLQITGIISHTQFTASRGYGPSNPAAHSNGATATMLCSGVNWAVDGSQGPAMFWNIEDGTFIKDNSGLAGGHGAYAFNNPGYRISANGWSAMIISNDADPVEAAYGITDSPAFAGVAPSLAGNDHQKHPSAAQQFDAVSTQQNWGSDILAQITHAGFDLNSPVNITGSLWKFTKNAADLNRKLLPTHATAGVKILRDISSTATGNVIGGTSADYYKYCVANAVNECRTGSAVGDVYVNAPVFGARTITNATNANPIVITTQEPHGYFQSGTVVVAGVGGNTAANGTWTATPLTPYTFSLPVAGNGTYTSGGTALRTPGCFSGGESITLGYAQEEDEVCFGDMPTYSQQAVQLRLDRADTTGRNGRQLGHMLTPPHRLAATASTKAVPDGRSMIIAANPSYNNSRSTENVLLTVPTFPADDSIDRTTFIQKPVALSGPGSAVTAITEFGYDTAFYCTSRSEVCVSAQGNNPFWYASENYSRISCPGGSCSNNIPVIPDRSVYYRHKFYDGSGTLVGTSSTFLLQEDSAPPAVVAAVVISGTVTISGGVVIID